MAMTQEQFVALIQQLDVYAREQPQSYRLRLILLAILGYAYIMVMLLLALGLTTALLLALFSGQIGAGIIKLLLFLVVLDYMILRALWVRFPPPEGRILARASAPALFRLIDELVEELGAPPFHRVLLDTDYNAGVLQRPRLGIFGWQQNYLVLGLPMMMALSPEQFRAVLAHELGHLYGQHSRFSGWIYRIRASWGQLLSQLSENEHFGSFLFTGFANWYAPYFNAYSFTTARRQEYEADQVAANLAGPRNAAEALIAVTVNGTLLDKQYWQPIYKLTHTEAQPPNEVFTRMLPMLQQPIPAEDAEQWLRDALAEETGYADTHPALRDRLRALEYIDDGNVITAIPPRTTASAADVFLGKEAIVQYAREFDASWQGSIAPMWESYHAEVQDGQQTLTALEEKALSQPLTEEEAWQRAKWTAQLKSEEEALPLLQQMLALWPAHDDANFAYGSLLLARDDSAGIPPYRARHAGALRVHTAGMRSDFDLPAAARPR